MNDCHATFLETRQGGAVELSAFFLPQDLARALVHLAPVRLHFTPEDEDTRWIELERPEEALVVAEEGLRITSSGRLRYTVHGLPFELDLRRIRIVVKPQVLEQDEQARLCFRLRVEELNIKYVPSALDAIITRAVDAAITPKTTQLVWKFGRTLSHRFQMPSRLEPIDSLGLQVRGGRFFVQNEGMRLVVDFAPLDVERSHDRPIEGSAADQSRQVDPAP
jgi:hypothetical protein